MIRCNTCVMPNTRPDTPFVNGTCQACINYSKRPEVDWHQRGIQLAELLDRHHGECIVPSSGGKDSTAQVMKLLAMGANVTVVTARTCHLTDIGRKNIDNLARHARTIEVVPNMTVRAKLNRLGLEMVGDISWPEHVAIFTIPFNVASDLRCPLMFFGENPQDQYGGPLGSEEAWHMTNRWRSEFGGFLGLRPDDMVGQRGITDRDMDDYRLKNPSSNTVAHFLGAYLPWDSHHNAEVAMQAGMSPYRDTDGIARPPACANLWPAENLDNAQTGLHDYLMYRKYGYGRGCAQASVDVRMGLGTREQALEWVRRNDGLYPHEYAGVLAEEVLERIGMSLQEFKEVERRFVNLDLFTEDSNYTVLKGEER